MARGCSHALYFCGVKLVLVIKTDIVFFSLVRRDTTRGEKLHGIGPTLYGILGRKAGEMADLRYSRALSGITWTA